MNEGQQVPGDLKSYLRRGAILTLALQAASVLLSLGASVMIARLGGAAEFGIYSWVFAWVNVLCIPALFGLDDLLVKEIPIYQSRQQEPQVGGLLRWTFRAASLATVVVVLVFACVVLFTPLFGLREYSTYFVAALPVIPLFVAMHLQQAALRGMQQMGAGQMAEKLIKPLAFVLLLLVWAWAGASLSDARLIWLSVLSFLPPAAMAWWAFRKARKGAPPSSEWGQAESSRWRKSCWYFTFIAVLQILGTRIDLILLGAFMGDQPEELAYYNVAVKFAELLLVPFVMANTITAPVFARMYANGEHESLQKVYTRTTRQLALLTLLAWLGMILLGPYIIGIFGKDFGAGYLPLIILGGGELLYGFVGTAGFVLIMAGQERAAAMGHTISLAVAVTAHIILIPLYGIMGAAIATTIGFVVHNILITYFSKRKLGLRVGIFEW